MVYLLYQDVFVYYIPIGIFVIWILNQGQKVHVRQLFEASAEIFNMKRICRYFSVGSY